MGQVNPAAAMGMPPMPPEAMMAGGAPPAMPGGPEEMGEPGGGMPSESDMLRMLFEQVVGGLDSQQAQISGVQDGLLQALMQAAGAVAPPDPSMLMPMEGVPMGAGPGPAGPPPGAAPASDADMLAGMV